MDFTNRNIFLRSPSFASFFRFLLSPPSFASFFRLLLSLPLPLPLPWTNEGSRSFCASFFETPLNPSRRLLIARERGIPARSEPKSNVDHDQRFSSRSYHKVPILHILTASILKSRILATSMCLYHHDIFVKSHEANLVRGNGF